MTDTKEYLGILAFFLFSVILVGVYYLVTAGPTTQQAAFGLSYPAWIVFAYAAGLTMIFLPCTLPLAFVIVPMAMGEDKEKGFMMALLFGAGLTLTITLYTTAFAILGDSFGFNKAAQSALLFGGVIAFIFGLEQLDILPYSLPEYGGSYPDIITEHGDYLRSFLLGLFLGNAGIGCPNPLFWWMSVFIAASGETVLGASLGVIHGIGRAVPLIFLSIMAMIGANMLTGLKGKSGRVKTVSGMFLLPVAAFILTFGVFGMPWWEQSIAHEVWNTLVAETKLKKEAGVHGIQVNNIWAGVTGEAGTTLAWLFFTMVLGLPLLYWYWGRGGEW